MLSREFRNWNCDLVLSKPELDLYRSPVDYFRNIILAPLLTPSPDLPRIPQATFLFLSPPLYHQTLPSLPCSSTHYLQPLMPLTKLSLPHLSLNLTSLPCSEDEDLSLRYLKRLKSFLTTIMNEQETYLIEKRLGQESEEPVRKWL